MAKGRYSRTKGRTKGKDDGEDKWFAPNMWGDSRYPIVKAALDSVDEVARTLEQRWGIGRLQRIAPPDLVVKFARQPKTSTKPVTRTTIITWCKGHIAGWCLNEPQRK